MPQSDRWCLWLANSSESGSFILARHTVNHEQGCLEHTLVLSQQIVPPPERSFSHTAHIQTRATFLQVLIF